MIKIVRKHVNKKDGDAFTRHGFVKLCDSHKKVQVMVNDTEYLFDFVTNFIYEIPSERIKFAIALSACNKKRILFLNKNYILQEHSTSPYRTYYSGLMKEPFRFCYPFDGQVIVQTEECRLKFNIIDSTFPSVQ